MEQKSKKFVTKKTVNISLFSDITINIGNNNNLSGEASFDNKTNISMLMLMLIISIVFDFQEDLTIICSMILVKFLR